MMEWEAKRNGSYRSSRAQPRDPVGGLDGLITGSLDSATLRSG